MSPARYRDTKSELQRSLVVHRAELDRSLLTLGRAARSKVDPRAIVARHPYAGMLTLAAFGLWLGSR
jgi:hypothetical protein